LHGRADLRRRDGDDRDALLDVDGDGVEPAVPVSGTLTSAAGGAAGVVAGVVSYIVGVVVGVMLATGPIGDFVTAVIATLAGAVAGLTGREATMDGLRNSQLPPWMRRMLVRRSCGARPAAEEGVAKPT
jgi:hypothetical protein